MHEMTTFRSRLLCESYTRIRHKSGLDIFVFPKQLTTTYAILAARYGSADTRFCLAGDGQYTEVPDGIAHFLEHKLFANEDGIDSFEKFSAYGADANAYTSHDRTAYLFSCTENFRESLTELLHFVIHPYFTPESIEKEQGIIAEEIRMSEDNPSVRRYYQLLRALYHSPRIYTHICGTQESIKKITDRILYDCHRVFYQPSNMTLVVCGDVTAEEVLAVADAVLPEPKRTEIIRDIPPEPREICQKKISSEMDIAQPIFAIGIKDDPFALSPEGQVHREAIFSVLCEMLFNQSGELYNALYEEELLLGGLGFGYDVTEAYAFVGLSGTSPDPDALLARVIDAVEKAKREGLCRESFARCKRVMYANFVRAFDSTSDIADLMLDYLFAGIEPLSYAESLDAVTFEETEALLREAFLPERFALSVVYPRKGE